MLLRLNYSRTSVPPRIGGETAENNVHRSSFNVQRSSFNVLVHVRLVIASVASCAGRRAWVAVTSASLVPLSSVRGLRGASLLPLIHVQGQLFGLGTLKELLGSRARAV